MKNLINEEVQLSKKVKSSKFLKTCFVGCLATCLTLTGIFAFAPLGANAQASSSSQNSSLNNNVNNSTTSTTESTGLITPRADDPVLFTTESGLEIKWGNVAIEQYYSTEYSAGFTGLPYFTAAGIYWAVIGVGISPDRTPAGQAIADSNANSSYASKLIELAESNMVRTSSEIPFGCVLVLRLKTIGSSAYFSSNQSSGLINGVQHTGYVGTTLQLNFQKYWIDGDYQMEDILVFADDIVEVDLVTQGYCEDTTGNLIVFSDETKAHIFPLGQNSGCSFYIETYLPTQESRKWTTSALSNGTYYSSSWLRGCDKKDISYAKYWGGITGDYYSKSLGTTSIYSVPACVVQVY